MQASNLHDARTAAFAIAALGALTIAGAWILEAWGYKPCELCLQQRTAYYVGIPLSLALGLGAPRAPRALIAIGLVLVGLMFLANAGLGVYHSGVEWKFWQGPTACTGSTDAPLKAADLMKQLQTIKVVRCDQVQLRILGLSLANANAVISAVFAGLAGFAAAGTLRRG